ncbi:hypothetical protein BCON_0522g00010 [Botryotinia convoluta]|uniref:Uncharacterized protein n=1 Tax=Botryotinia convoluta TaxID=54673 RepID=A0A4Z1H5G2_9HELO|nr:hypothetical protein BCON_0522g00010 [Botryotinia convoluta]
MSRVLPTLCVLTQMIFRMIERIHELQEKILNKDDVIHDLWTRVQWAERRVVGLTAEMAEKDTKVAGYEAEITALKAELAAVGAGQQANLGEGEETRERKRKRSQ